MSKRFKSNRISQFKRSSRSTGKHFSIRHHAVGRSRSNGFLSVIGRKRRGGSDRVVSVDDGPPAKRLRGVSGRVVTPWQFPSIENVVESVRDGYDRARNVMRELGEVARDVGEVARTFAPGMLGAAVARRVYRANALPAARY